MSDTHEHLLQTSADVGEEFSQAMESMFALRMMLPAVIEDAGPEGRQDTLQCGVGNFLDDIHAKMLDISEAHWTLLHAHRRMLVDQGKVEAPMMLPITANAATGTDG